MLQAIVTGRGESELLLFSFGEGSEDEGLVHHMSSKW